MVYKVFISTTNDAMSETYVKAVKLALWQLNEFPVSPTTMGDIAQDGDDPMLLIRQMLDATDIFIGVYGSDYGQADGKNLAEFIELEYSYARERGITTLIFIPAMYDTTNERLKAFKQRIKETQVIQSFNTLDDLKAQVIIGVTNFRQNMRQNRRMGTAPSRIAPVTEVPVVINDTFELTVRRALNLVEEDIENLVRRAIAVQSASSSLDPGQRAGVGHQMTINPVFGTPNHGSQFQADIFMIMPFREQLNAVYINVVRPVVTDLNLTIKRGDEFTSISGQIISEVWAAINACKLVIVDTTEENANVYYELGIAHTLGKPAILITQAREVEEFPFDIRHLRFIVYENTIPGGEKLEADLRRAIIWILNDLEEQT